jgi:hypothetical protein
MENHSDPTIPRRTFLRGAVGLVGASVLATSPALASFAMLEEPLSIMYWNGERFVPAYTLTPDRTIQSVDLELHGFGGPGAIRSIDCNPLISTPKGLTSATVYAWTAPPRGCDTTKLRMPVDANSGLRFTVDCGQQSGPASVLFAVAGTKVDPKLREGVYAIAVGNIDWAALELDESEGSAQIRRRSAEGEGSLFQHVLLKIRAA